MMREDVDRLAHYAAMLGIPLGDEHAALRDHHETVAATLRALLAERDAAFAAGQEEMRELAALEAERGLASAPKRDGEMMQAIAEGIRDIPIKRRP